MIALNVFGLIFLIAWFWLMVDFADSRPINFWGKRWKQK